MHRLRVAPAHFRLGGMNVHVHAGGVAAEEEERDRTPPPGRQEVRIRLPDGVRHGLVADVPARDEHLLQPRVATMERRRPDPGLELQIRRTVVHAQECARHLVTVHGADPLAAIAAVRCRRGTGIEDDPRALREAERDLREREGEPPHQRRDVPELRRRGAQEFPAGGHPAEEPLHSHDRPGRGRGRPHVADIAVVVLDARTGLARRAPGRGCAREPRSRCSRAPPPETRDWRRAAGRPRRRPCSSHAEGTRAAGRRAPCPSRRPRPRSGRVRRPPP